LILTLIGLVRATNPAMLRQTSDGFTVDFESLQGKTELTDDERILNKLRIAFESPVAPGDSGHTLELAAAEGERLAVTLERLEKLQSWPADVLTLSRGLRARLTP
jgi:predicted ATPase